MDPASRGVFAAIDVGTNAVRLKIARRSNSGSLKLVHQNRDPLRPGDAVFQTGVIPDATVDRLVFTLCEYADEARHHRAVLRAVATSALRNAHNRAEVIARVKLEANVTLEVITGLEEARLTCLGVLEGTAADVRSLCLDIGGGSTELALARGEHPAKLFSVEMGALRLMDQLDPTARFQGSLRERLWALAEHAVTALPAGIDDLRHAVVSSGTTRALVAFATGETREMATLDELAAATTELLELGPAGRRRFYDRRRADLVVTGGVILVAVMRRLGLHSVRAVRKGLRDGVLIDLSRRDAALLVESRLRAVGEL
jgi:exopolyphosphatase/guanosine-5'-triphosphate,3'-diphosphate pyrophosphatase